MRKENVLKDTYLGEKTRLKLRGLVTNKECIYIILPIWLVIIILTYLKNSEKWREIKVE